MSGFRELWGSFREQCAFNLLPLVPESILNAAVSHPVSCARSGTCLTLYEADPVCKVVSLQRNQGLLMFAAICHWSIRLVTEILFMSLCSIIDVVLNTCFC